MSYILLREAYIANTRNYISGTSGDSDKCMQQLHSSSHTRQCVMWKTSPSHTHTQHTCMYTHMHTHTCTHTHMHNTHAHTHTCTHTRAPMLRLFFLRSYDTQNCLVARPLFSFPSLSVHTARNKMQSESRATPTLHKIKGSIIDRTIRVFYC